jgi:hypothetical protein
MAENAQKNDGLSAGKVVSGGNQVEPKGFRDSPKYNMVLGVVIFCLAVGVFLIIRSQNSRPDGRVLLELTAKRVEKQVTSYLAKKVIKTDNENIQIPKSLSFKPSPIRFTTRDLEGVRVLPEVIEFEMDLVTTGGPEERQGKVTGQFEKDTGGMLLIYDLIYVQDSVPSAYGAWDEEVMVLKE